jgi:hypothetical protein
VADALLVRRLVEAERHHVHGRRGAEPAHPFVKPFIRSVRASMGLLSRQREERMEGRQGNTMIVKASYACICTRATIEDRSRIVCMALRCA